MRHISPTPLDIGNILSMVADPSAGGLVLFLGNVRSPNRGRIVARLEYEAQTEMAETIIARILSQTRSEFGLTGAACVHRIGRVAPGESAVIIATAAPHRAAAYDANRRIIDRVKAEAPIWKKEFFTDGAAAWDHEGGAETRDHAH